MVDTLHHAGGIGLAAPQIDVPVRLAIIEIPGGASRYGEIPAMPLTVFANPRIEVVNPATAGYWEGCLSVPGLRGWVERPSTCAFVPPASMANPSTWSSPAFSPPSSSTSSTTSTACSTYID
jgi:hypothetical protein